MLKRFSPVILFWICLLFVNNNTCLGCVGFTPGVTANPATAICPGTSVTLSATPVLAGIYTYAWSMGGTNATENVAPTTTTTYTVSVSSIICTATATVTVTVNPNPVAAVTPSAASVCQGSTSILTASGGGTYKWSSNATTASITVPSTTTTYTVIVTSAAGCTATASSAVTVYNSIAPALNAAGTTGEVTFNGLPYFIRCTSTPPANIAVSNATSVMSS